MNWYNYTWSYVVNILNSDVYYGLNDEQIHAHREQNGDNKIRVQEHKNIVLSILKEFNNLWILVFLINILILIYENNYKASILVIAIFIMNLTFILMFIKENFKGLKEIDRLNNYNARVIRSGNYKIIPLDELVVGDIVCLEKGNIVPADLRIINSHNLRIKENSITGENYIVDKYETKIEEKNIDLSEMNNILFRSSYVYDGEAMGVVICTGMNTEIGKIINATFSSREKKYIFNKSLVKNFNLSALILLVIMFILFFVNFTNRLNLKQNLFELGNFLLLGTVNGLMIALYLAYIFITFNLKKDNIYLKNINCLYEINDIDIITFEKESSLGKNLMVLKNIYINFQNKCIEDPEFHMDEDIERILSIALLCSNGKYNRETGEIKGELEDIEIMKFLRDFNIFKNQLEAKYPRILEISKDSHRKTMTTINRIDNNYRANVKGFLDYILERCTHIRINGVEREITKEDIFKIKNINIKLCGQSLNVVALASRAFSYEPSLNENIESNLVFEGLLAFYNPLKEHYEESLNYYKLNCIKPMFITKENKLTAYSIGKKLNLLTNVDGVLSGAEINYMNHRELDYSIGKANILTHVDYISKTKVTKKLKEKGYNVAMEGTYLKDLSYLMYCYLSIAVGKNCSNILKKICDVFIQEFNLESFKNLLNASKRIKKFFENIYLYFTYAIICKASNLLIFKIIGEIQVIPNYLYLYINIVSMSLMYIVIFKETSSFSYSEKPEESIKNKGIIKYIIFGIIPCIIFKLLLHKGRVLSSKISFLTLNFFISIIPLCISERENIFFRYKLSNVIFILNLILSFFIFLF